jgi:hypothetical protein
MGGIRRRAPAFNHNGKVIYTKPMVAHDVRLKATDMILKLLGAYPTAEQQTNVGVRVISMEGIPRPDRSAFYRNNGEEDE